jgi:hypothetical protein
MLRRIVVTSMGAAVMLAVFTSTAAYAQPFDKRTYFTFSDAVAVPGATLPAGKYLFRLADETSHEVVQVLSADGRKPYALFFAMRVERLDIPSKPEVRFLETAAGEPEAIQTWWYPGERTGYEFVYPKAQARVLAAGAGHPVLAAAEMPVAPSAPVPELARITPSGEEAAAEATPPSPAGSIREGEIALLSITIVPSQSRTRLPNTASAVPLMGGLGVLLIIGGACLRGWRSLSA